MIFTADKNDYMTAYNGNCLSKPSLIILRLDECALSFGYHQNWEGRQDFHILFV